MHRASRAVTISAQLPSYLPMGDWRMAEEAGMSREWHSEPGVDRVGEVLATIFLAAVLALFLYAYLPHFL
jgi:hypothetical protein